MTKNRAVSIALESNGADQFTVLRELTTELDRLSFGLPEIEMRRRNGVFRFIVRLPHPLHDSLSIRVDGNSLVVDAALTGEVKQIQLPACINPADVAVRFFEGVLVVELPYAK